LNTYRTSEAKEDHFSWLPAILPTLDSALLPRVDRITSGRHLCDLPYRSGCGRKTDQFMRQTITEKKSAETGNRRVRQFLSALIVCLLLVGVMVQVQAQQPLEEPGQAQSKNMRLGRI